MFGTWQNKNLLDEAPEASRKLAHKVIKEITNAYENNAFNVVVAQIRILFNDLNKNPSKENLQTLLVLMQPLAPHIAEELLGEIGNFRLVVAAI